MTLRTMVVMTLAWMTVAWMDGTADAEFENKFI